VRKTACIQCIVGSVATFRLISSTSGAMAHTTYKRCGHTLPSAWTRPAPPIIFMRRRYVSSHHSRRSLQGLAMVGEARDVVTRDFHHSRTQHSLLANRLPYVSQALLHRTRRTFLSIILHYYAGSFRSNGRSGRCRCRIRNTPSRHSVNNQDVYHTHIPELCSTNLKRWYV